MKKMVALLIGFIMIASLAACDQGETTTVTGMVVSVDGTVLSLIEMDADSMGGMDFTNGQRPEKPEGMEDFEGFGGFGSFGGFGDFGDINPEDFAGMMPGGGNFPQWGSGQMPELPEGMTIPNFNGSGFGNAGSDAQTKSVDIGNAHITVEIEGGKASGSMSDITVGSFVTVTLNSKGKVTNVLVSSRSSFAV